MNTAPTPGEVADIVALFNAEQYVEVESRARVLLQTHAQSGFLWSALGVALKMQGKDAIPALRQAAQLLPDDAETHNNLGGALRDCGKFEEAAASCRRALEIKFDFAGAHGNLATALRDLGQYEVAASSYRRALSIQPDFALVYSNFGTVLRSLGQLDGAAASYRRALEINPAYAEAHSNLLFIHNYQSDLPPATLLAEARRFGDTVARRARPYQDWPNVPAPEKCLRVGLVSGDLRIHPVGFFIDGVLAALAAHSAGRIELIAYASQPNADVHDDALTARLKACCRDWRNVVALSDEQLAHTIREDGIDILIDLSGHTAHNRLPMFAWKPAPVQATWLGYFATTGVAAIAYLIADPWTAPQSVECQFTEQVWRLPETRLCFTPPHVEVAADTTVSSLPALANGYLTFGCFNDLAKMNDAVVSLWAGILQAVPHSRLFLKAKQLNADAERQRTVARFTARGIDAQRLVLEGQSFYADYLAAYQRVDIALDPFPFPGGTTSADALWMGVPVLTLAGERFLSRQGVGVLANAGLPDWIAADREDYLARAVRHAGDVHGLVALRQGLRRQVLASPPFDAPRFAGHFEAALRGMWRQWCRLQKSPASMP